MDLENTNNRSNKKQEEGSIVELVNANSKFNLKQGVVLTLISNSPIINHIFAMLDNQSVLYKTI